jgi:hypothetical protein
VVVPVFDSVARLMKKDILEAADLERSRFSQSKPQEELFRTD